MRYILNDTGYIEAVSFGCMIECEDKTCTEYTGTVPTGYESLVDWNENANINAYKIVDGNLTYDSAEDTRLQTLWANQLSVSGGGTNTNNYSTEEQKIGTWKDGKPLYRKVVDFGALHNAQGTSSVAHGISNIDKITVVNAMGYEGDYAFPIPFVANEWMFANIGYAVRVNKSNIFIYVSADRSMQTAIVTLEYTKTTD